MISIVFLALQLMAGSLSLVGPQYPPNAVMGGTVVAELQFVKGVVRDLTILSGDEPFVGPSKSALNEWRLGSDEGGRELVIVQYRQPYLQFIINSKKEEIRQVKRDATLPYPKYIIQPFYPANSHGEGSVILQTEISVEGRVSNVKVLKSLGSLTDAGIDAVRQWEFSPARDERGNIVMSHAYVVLVFRSPLM
jgi:TonB family protein